MTATTTGCGFWLGAERRFCGVTDGVRRYLPGHRCPNHAPAAERDRCGS